MGHPILKHMNSFKASNDLKYNPVVDKASALRQNKGSMAYQKDMAPEMNGPLDVTKAGQKKILASDANQAFKAAIAKESPTEMHGALHMDKGAPAMNKGSMAYNQGEKDKDDESIAGRLGKRGLNISSKDRRDESLGKYGTRT